MIKAVLFDFDGTLADTAPDLGHALNQQRIIRGLPELTIEQIRPIASAGSRGLLELGFNIKPGHHNYETMRDEFLDFYTRRLCHDTRLFPGISELLEQLRLRNLPWGIVTNKPARFTRPGRLLPLTLPALSLCMAAVAMARFTATKVVNSVTLILPICSRV